MIKNVKPTFKRTPLRPPGPKQTACPLGLPPRRLSPAGDFSPFLPPRQHYLNPRGWSRIYEQRRSPQVSPTLAEARVESIVYTTPPPPQPHPPPLLRGQRERQGYPQGRALPSPAARPGNPTTKQFRRGEAASGSHGAPVEAGAVLQGTGGSILISISAPLLLRCLPGFLLSCCQLGSADRSELLPARTNRKA